jgi:hypothetical protein
VPPAPDTTILWHYKAICQYLSATKLSTTFHRQNLNFVPATALKMRFTVEVGLNFSGVESETLYGIKKEVKWLR